MKPVNFMRSPMSSILQKSEAEWVAQNIMKILARTGNEWRKLTFEEYEKERLADAENDNFGYLAAHEKKYFDQVIDYTISAEAAISFCKGWPMEINTRGATPVPIEFMKKG